ncbi:MAG: copper oxidase [Chloroflexi bacterium]|nr:MAG: copper oxidase [Chloroflexota bacterium]
MSQIKPARNHRNGQFSRRDVLKLGGGLLGALAGSVALPKALLKPEGVAAAAGVKSAAKASIQRPVYDEVIPNKHLAGTDGWIHLPGDPRPPYFPDNMTPDPLFNTYIFGYHDVSGVAPQDLIKFKMKAQLAAPVLILEELEPYYLKLTNLGLQLRPDLIDAHTVHFHGFRNAIPIFDGEPHSSVGVPIIRDLTYYYMPRDPGTYMYHCHFEETEHVHMGMIGPAFIRPALNKTLAPRKFVYNDESTEYNREFYLCLSEVWLEAHWADSHIQLPEWSDYKPEFYLINGRAYPDTIVGNGYRDATGEMVGPAGREDLANQPVTSLITTNEFDQVLLRVNNLGFETVTMTLAGIKMRVIARDAVQLKGRNEEDLSFMTSSITLGSGESTDVIFEAPAYQGVNGVGQPDKYLFYSRNLAPLNNAGWAGKGGQMTEVHVFPRNDSITLPDQTEPNT